MQCGSTGAGQALNAESCSVSTVGCTQLRPGRSVRPPLWATLPLPGFLPRSCPLRSYVHCQALCHPQSIPRWLFLQRLLPSRAWSTSFSRIYILKAGATPDLIGAALPRIVRTEASLHSGCGEVIRGTGHSLPRRLQQGVPLPEAEPLVAVASENTLAVHVGCACSNHILSFPS